MIQHEKGKWGEDRAADFLRNRNFKILKRNFRKAYGEVDIIAVKDKKIVFFEVKKWDSYNWEDLHCSINRSKIRRIQNLAEIYLQDHPEYKNYKVGFDLILLSRRTEEPDHIVDFI